jgi:hypothetical protein
MTNRAGDTATFKRHNDEKGIKERKGVRDENAKEIIRRNFNWPFPLVGRKFSNKVELCAAVTVSVSDITSHFIPHL